MNTRILIAAAAALLASACGPTVSVHHHEDDNREFERLRPDERADVAEARFYQQV